jgi:hypothetical protein
MAESIRIYFLQSDGPELNSVPIGKPATVNELACFINLSRGKDKKSGAGAGKRRRGERVKG